MQKTIIYDSISIFDQIATIINIAKVSTLIIAPTQDIKVKITKKLAFSGLIKSDELNKIASIEKEVADFADAVALSQEISIKNIMNITTNRFTKSELKMDWNEFLQNNPIPKITDLPVVIREAIAQNSADIWFTKKPILEYFSAKEIQEKYEDIFDEKIRVCIPTEVSSKTIFDSVIIIDANSVIYNKIVPFLSEQNIDILPNIREENQYFSIASACLKANKLTLFKNLNNKNISYFLLYLKNSELIKKQITKAEYKISNFTGNGTLSCVLTPKNIEKLAKNPLYFYLEYILKLKEKKALQEKIFSFEIERNISDFIQNNKLCDDDLSVSDKYKLLNSINKTKKLLKIEDVLQNKIYKIPQSIINNINGNEIIVEPNFILSNNDNIEYYFYTKSSISAIKNGIDIISLAILNAVPSASKVFFINYKKNNFISVDTNINTSQIKDLISKYKKDCKYSQTQEYSGFSKYYQHFCRNLLIKN